MTYTLDDIRPMILEIIATKPKGYTYDRVPCNDEGETRCQYRTMEGEPSCIVGHLFDKLGVVATGIEGKIASGAISQLLLDFDAVAITYLDNLQSNQDSGFPWADSEAVAYDHVTSW